ncbi:MAG TPA: DUF4136 domain-containing protein [Flavobacteriaceae bacterium]|jgi:hypothetical protein|nr:hypothetical protein [Flavobacteriaceae bacterium]MAM30166.1 hypothetical protein [Flavobacteriaceae bacterium]MAY54164.1 hypothetical protein [Flavobacteriaceae bacterium]HBR53155.1 DUF4136 domain-containing protein [Flavobacteriaceae bacterium]HIB49284.1 DUF4136 domain-containing protein [Flavobacteriaceae bacterium]|tara:strand:- start:456 stop:998 length:543 start_codon:yes stop_codon:yes gene_type:complete
MKIFKFIPILLLVVLVSSCTSVRVATDYDRAVDFNAYNSYAFYKPGIDQAKISDLDKRRILRAIEANLAAKGMTKSETPSLLVSIFTKERERVDVYNNNFGWGWGWNPWWGGGFGGSSVSTTVEGSLYIDLLDAKTNQLVWQGVGRSRLYTGSDIDKREAKIREIVAEILAEYPPGASTN